MRYGLALKKRREALELSREELAARSGVPLQFIIDIEEARRKGAKPTPPIMQKIEQVVGAVWPTPERH